MLHQCLWSRRPRLHVFESSRKSLNCFLLVLWFYGGNSKVASEESILATCEQKPIERTLLLATQLNCLYKSRSSTHVMGASILCSTHTAHSDSLSKSKSEVYILYNFRNHLLVYYQGDKRSCDWSCPVHPIIFPLSSDNGWTETERWIHARPGNFSPMKGCQGSCDLPAVLGLVTQSGNRILPAL